MDNCQIPQFLPTSEIRLVQPEDVPFILCAMTNTQKNMQQVSPCFLMSNIPGALGYHPDDCLVVFLLELHCADECRGEYHLGPMFRVDMPDLQASSEFAEYIAAWDPDLVMAAVIGDERTKATALEFERQCCELEVPLVAVWHVPELYSGARYVRIGGESADSLGPYTSGKAFWDEGTIGEIVAAPAMAAFRRRGELPDASRDDALEFFARDDKLVSVEEAAQLGAAATQHADSLLRAISNSGPAEAETLVDNLYDDLFELVDQILVEDISVRDLVAELEHVEQIAPFFARSALRDPLLEFAVSDNAEGFFRLCVAVARATIGVTRVNALCCAALAASFSERGHRVPQALQCAFEEDPAHRLSHLMMQALQCGGLQLVHQACREGSELALAALKNS